MAMVWPSMRCIPGQRKQFHSWFSCTERLYSSTLRCRHIIMAMAFSAVSCTQYSPMETMPIPFSVA